MHNIQTKICGITTLDDATAAVSLGADAIGLNFYSGSKRYVKPEIAAEISLLHSESVAIFGVFVGYGLSEIVSVANDVRLSHVQLHSDETVEQMEEIRQAIADVKIVRAIRIADNDMQAAQAEIDCWVGAGVDFLLLDAAAPGEFGGTGNRLDWVEVSKLKLPANWLLAGGLNPENVSDAIQLAKPGGVDVASGVEKSPGVKDEVKLKSFIDQARQTYGSATK